MYIQLRDMMNWRKRKRSSGKALTSLTKWTLTLTPTIFYSLLLGKKALPLVFFVRLTLIDSYTDINAKPKCTYPELKEHVRASVRQLLKQF